MKKRYENSEIQELTDTELNESKSNYSKPKSWKKYNHVYASFTGC